MKKGMFNEAAWKWSSPRGGWKGGGRLPKDMEIKIGLIPECYTLRVSLSLSLSPPLPPLLLDR